MSAATEILHDYQHVIESISLIPGEKGVFDVTVDGDVIYSKHETGRHAEPGEVFDIFAKKYAADVTPYDHG